MTEPNPHPHPHPNYESTISYKPEEVTYLSLINGQGITLVPGTFEEYWIETSRGRMQAFRCRDLYSESQVVHGKSDSIVAMWTRVHIDSD